MRKLLPGSMALGLVASGFVASGLVAFGLVTLGLGAPALAGDLDIAAPAYKTARPVMRAYDWTGFYVGGNVGGHRGFDRITTATDPDGFGVDGTGAAGAAAIDAASPITLHPQGFIGGVQGGYNLEGSGGVFGIEVDANWLGGSAARTLRGIPVISPLDVMTNTSQATFLSTMRMRWGAEVSDRALFFVSAGFAFGTIKTTDTMGHFGNTVITSTSTSKTQPGFAAGGGFEYAFTDNLSARFEYLYVVLKSFDAVIPATPGNLDDITVGHNFSDHIGRFGLNLKLGG